MTPADYIAIVVATIGGIFAFLSTVVVGLVSWGMKTLVASLTQRIVSLELTVETQRQKTEEHGAQLAGHAATAQSVDQRLDELRDTMGKVQDGINLLLNRNGLTPRGTPSQKI